MKHVNTLAVAVAFATVLVQAAGCEPEPTPDEAGATIGAVLFTPEGQVDCTSGCAVDLGEIAVGAARETPLIFSTDVDTVISDVQREGCDSFSIRVPGPFATRSTTSIRLEGAEAGTCASTFSFVGDADNIDAVVIDVSATIVGAAADTDDDVGDVPG